MMLNVPPELARLGRCELRESMRRGDVLGAEGSLADGADNSEQAKSLKVTERQPKSAMN